MDGGRGVDFAKVFFFFSFFFSYREFYVRSSLKEKKGQEMSDIRITVSIMVHAGVERL